MMQQPDNFDAQLRAAFEPTYAVERELIGGGMSRVFLATERALNRRVVIKVLPLELAAGVNRERFRREVQLAAQLQHPHIVPLYAAGEQGDLLFYTMPFIEGESLKQAIHDRGKSNRLSPKEVAGILHDVTDALAYAHARGVIHRDIKPGNVLRSGRHAVVTDFGVAKAISASMPAVGMTTSGMAIGTPAYMAPEQLAGDPAADHRVDIYAVGLLAYELLTGDAPFAESSPQQTMAAQLTRDPAPIDRARLDVPPALSALVMRCLAKDPAKRPQSATELLAELDALALDSGNYPPTRPPRARHGVFLAAGVAAILAAVWFAARQGAARSKASGGASTASSVPTSPALGPPAAASVLTRADSLAIAKAVQKKITERATAAPAPALADSATIARIANQLRGEVERAVLDSLSRLRPQGPPAGAGRQLFIDRSTDMKRFPGLSESEVDSIVRASRGAVDMFTGGDGRGRMRLDRVVFDQRARNMGPPRRVVVWDHPPDRRSTALTESGTAIMNLLWKRLALQTRLVPVNHDSTQAVLARTRSRDSVTALLNADMMATIRGTPIGGDSLLWLITLHDPTASGGSQRSAVARASTANPLAVSDTLVALAIRALDDLDRAPRRAPPDARTMSPAASPIVPAPPKKP